MTAWRRPVEVDIKRPSDIDALGAILRGLGANDGDALRSQALTLPLQVADLLRGKGLDETSVAAAVAACERHLNEAAAALEMLIPAGEGLERVAETIVYLLRSKRSAPVERDGYSITGVDTIAM